MRARRRVGLVLLVLAAAVGCTSRPLPPLVYYRAIYPPSHYALSAESSGVTVAVVPFAPGRDVYGDPAQPQETPDNPSLNVLNAGLLPVRLIVWNNSSDELVLDPEAIAGQATDVSYSPYPPEDAVAVVTGSEEFKNAIKGSQVGPVLHSLLGGEMLAEAVRGGVSGVTSGGITGGASGAATGAAGVGLARARGYEKSLIRLIEKEYKEHAITRRTLYPGFTADGLVFLPSRVGITRLEIRLYSPGTKRTFRLETALR